MGVVAMFARRPLTEGILTDLAPLAGQIAQHVQRKRAEEKLRESELRHRLVGQAANDAIWDWDLVTNRVAWNEGVQARFGYTPEQVGPDATWWSETIHPDDRERVAHGIHAAIDAGEELWQDEYRFRRADGAYADVFDRGRVVRASGRPVRMVGSMLDLTERKRAERTARFLAEASAALADLTDYESTLQKVASLAVPTFADWCAIDMLDESGGRRRVAATHADPSRVLRAKEIGERYPPRPDAPHCIDRVLWTGEPELAEDVPDALLAAVARDEAHLRTLRELGLRSYVCVPIRSLGRPLGGITFASDQPDRRYDEADLRVAQDLASRAAVAIQNASLYRALQEADRRKDEFLATGTAATGTLARGRRAGWGSGCHSSGGSSSCTAGALSPIARGRGSTFTVRLPVLIESPRPRDEDGGTRRLPRRRCASWSWTTTGTAPTAWG